MVFAAIATVVFMFTAVSFAAAQTPQFKVGDEIEAFTYGSMGGTTHWGKGKVVGFNPARQASPYEIQWDGQPTTMNEYIGRVRAREANGVGFKVGDYVDTFYGEKQGKGRGTVIEAGDGKYKVHYVGCKAYWDEWVDRTLVQSAATISVNAPEIRFLVGKWSMTTVGISSRAIAWGKSNDILINGDGSYTWYQSGGKPAVKGEWTGDPKVEGAKDGTSKIDGIRVKDAQGREWKLYRRIVGDNQDKVTIHQMCEGITDIGTRSR